MSRKRSAIRTNTDHIVVISYNLTRMVTWEAPLNSEMSWSPDGQGMLTALSDGSNCDEVGLATISDF